MEADQHSQIMAELGELKGIMSGVLTEAQKTNGRLNRLEDRMAKVEEFKNQQIGKQTTLGVLFGSVMSVIGIVVAKKLGF